MRGYTATELANNTGDVLLAAAKESVEITRHGRPRFVLMTLERFQDLTAQGEKEAVLQEDTQEGVNENDGGATDAQDALELMAALRAWNGNE